MLLPKTEPSVEVFDDMFRVNLYRNAKENGEVENFGVNFGENGGDNFGDRKHPLKNGQKLTDTQDKILDCIVEDKYISANKIAEKIGKSGRTVENNIKKMKEKGFYFVKAHLRLDIGRF